MEPCTRNTGPRGGTTECIQVWRRNGQTKLWKTRPNAYRIPVKFGLYSYGYITEEDNECFHTPEDCPLNS